jgi:protoheme IX farnesyltransferase
VAPQAVATALDLSHLQGRRLGSGTVLFDYLALTKPEITVLVAITTAAGFWMGVPAGPAHFPWTTFLQSLLGTALVAAGAATLNQLIERPYDARMRRTARRPLVSRRVAPSHALWFGVALSGCGIADLAISTNTLTASFAALTLVSYLFVYTPLKRITSLCTLAGAIPGAAPPLIGWAAARGHLDPAGWVLFAIVFLWQFPHFMPIAWMYRDDYAGAGYLIVPRGEKGSRVVAWQTVAGAAVLLAVSVMPTIIGLSGLVYLAGALVIGGILMYYSATFAGRRTNHAARQLLIVSVLYLPALFLLLVVDKL